MIIQMERFARNLREASAYTKSHTDSCADEPYYSCQMAIADTLEKVADALEEAMEVTRAAPSVAVER